MDIHNYDKRYQAVLRQVQNADIPERNKQLILDFGEADFGKKSVSRNPLLFGLLQRIELVEHVGSGILRIRNAAKEAEPFKQFRYRWV